MNIRQSLVLSTALTAATCMLAGCASNSRATNSTSPYSAFEPAARDTQLARQKYAQALAAWPKDPVKAETLLRESLTADIYHGPAHNNLGVLLLSRGELYAAAEEFEWAKRLMPGHPDPRVNLAMTLERAGRTDDALANYDSALASFDNYLPALMGKARLQIRTDRADADTIAALSQIALRGDEEWRLWAELWRVKLEVQN
jgi:tetratricopeptide (TPR) repeat protein